MPGKPGSGGPIPKREAQRRRANKPEVPVTHAAVVAPAAVVPDADALWHGVAREWWLNLGQASTRLEVPRAAERAASGDVVAADAASGPVPAVVVRAGRVGPLALRSRCPPVSERQR